MMENLSDMRLVGIVSQTRPQNKEASLNSRELNTWLDEVLPRHELLARSVVSIIENLLGANGIVFLAVTSRVKKRESVIEKVRLKEYEDPAVKLTDLTGVRIIVFFESQISEVTDLIRKTFNVDEENSVNKDARLGVDQVGYRSSHLVCDLGANRKDVPEYNMLNGLKFEFQVRTILQHAWAEFAHDKSYKFEGTLPPAAARKLYLYAGMLEVADTGLDELSKEIDAYAERTLESIAAGDLSMEIDSINLRGFLEQDPVLGELEQRAAKEIGFEFEGVKVFSSNDIDALKFLGVRTLEDLRSQLQSNADLIIKRCGQVFKVQEDVRVIPKGLILFFLTHALIARNLSAEERAAMLKKFYWFAADSFAKDLDELAESTKGTR